MDRRVVADEGQLTALEAEDPVGLGPTPVITDGHADYSAKGTVDSEAVSRLEVVALQVLEGPPWLVVLVAWKVHLAIPTDDGAIPLDQDRRVVPVTVRGQLGVPQVEAHAQSLGLVEQGAGLGTRHLGLVEVVGLGQVVDPPAGEERGQGQFREHHQVAASVGTAVQ